MLAELLYGSPLFHGATIEAVLGAQQAALGRVPRAMLLGDPETARMYYTPTGRLYSVDPMGQPRGVYSLRSTSPKPLGELLGVSDPEFISFLTGLLRLDPAERLSVAEALAHPWVADEVAAFREAKRELQGGEALNSSRHVLFPRSGAGNVTPSINSADAAGRLTPSSSNSCSFSSMGSATAASSNSACNTELSGNSACSTASTMPASQQNSLVQPPSPPSPPSQVAVPPPMPQSRRASSSQLGQVGAGQE